MAFHVVYAQCRNAPGKSQGLGTGSAHQQSADQARACGIGDGIDLGGDAVGFGQHLADQRQHALDVITRGQLRHYPAINAVQVDLTEQCIGQKAALTVV
ncbi:hypothetical protein D3C79_833280 [compost metagenome]